MKEATDSWKLNSSFDNVQINFKDDAISKYIQENIH